MRVVSKSTEADIAREQALSHLKWRLRELTANLLRITRGAGKPYEVVLQMHQLEEAIREYHSAAGVWPWDQFTGALRIVEDWETRQHWSAEERWRAEVGDQIISGALQIVASRLVGQRTQEAAGNKEMYEGLRAMEKIHTANRKACAQTMKDNQLGGVVAKPKPGRPRKA